MHQQESPEEACRGNPVRERLGSGRSEESWTSQTRGQTDECPTCVDFTGSRWRVGSDLSDGSVPYANSQASGTFLSIDAAMARAIEESSGKYASSHIWWKEEEEDASECSWEHGVAKAQIILSHKSPHTMNCEKVCHKHVHFLIRVLPKGHITPVSELLVPALEPIVRRHEEQFCVKTYEDFVGLYACLVAERTSTWGKRGSVTSLVPQLPAGSVKAPGLLGRMVLGRKRNPELESGLQEFLDTLMKCQLPPHASGPGMEPALAQFFRTDRVPVCHPLVQLAMKAHGGSFA